MLGSFKVFSAFKTVCGDEIVDPAIDIPNGVWIVIAIVLIACAVTAAVLTGRSRGNKNKTENAEESEDKKS